MESSIILVVDDTPDNLSLISGLLKNTWKTKVATGGAKALQIAAAEPRPSLILLDVMMPEMDGFEVCQRLKADPATAGIPVIFLSAKSEASDQAKGLALGAVAYVTKPVDPEGLLETIRRFV